MNPAPRIENPYAPPTADVDGCASVATEGAGLWRWGHLLVMRKDAQLPDVCLVSNQPGARRTTRVLSWYHPAWLFLILVNVFLFVVVALIVRKKAKLSLSLSEQVGARRRRAILGSCTLFLAALGACALISAGRLPRELNGALLLAAILAVLAAALWASLGTRSVSAKRMTSGFVWLKGVHPDFLAGLPEWQTGYKAPA